MLLYEIAEVLYTASLWYFFALPVVFMHVPRELKQLIPLPVKNKVQ